MRRYKAYPVGATSRRAALQMGAASLLGKLPAAVAPVGLDAEGLPIGLQVIAPYMADLSAVHFAGLIAREIRPPKLAA